MQSHTALWIARVLQVLVVLFMLVDSAGKYFMFPGVADAFSRQAMPLALAPVIATILLALTILYVIPRTSVLGAVLLTGYFGGACACNLRAGMPAFETVFPLIFACLMWVPVYLYNADVRALLPLRRT